MSIWPNIITGVCTLLAGLGGVWITQRGTASRTAEEWRDKHRIDQRQAVVDVLHLGRQWSYSLGLLRSTIALSGDNQDVEFLVNHKKFSYVDDYTAFQRALTTARIIVDVEDVAVHLRELTKLGNPLLFESEKLYVTNEPDKDKRLEAATSPTSAADKTLRRLEHAATRHLGAPVVAVKRPPRIRRFVARRRRSMGS
ncbi:hypothetical protein [Lentzea sp. NPDC059081]|uniref:hypothetical protein n=1 Tax=Lentzea sp. NPDC059081 TaxID=3346719 RepID=UPI003687E7F8